MTYTNDMKAATDRDLREVMRSDDPLQDVRDKKAELAEIRRFVDAEVMKWTRLESTLELFNDEAETATEPEDADSPALLDPPTESFEQAKQPSPSRFTIPAHRRAVLIGVLRSSPDRTWRTQEVAAEVQRFESELQPNMSNLVSRALGVLENEGLVTKIKQGVVKWSGPPDYPTTDYANLPQEFPAPDSLPTGGRDPD